MENITWYKPATTPAFGMPICASASRAAHVRVDGVRSTGLATFEVYVGSDAWSPPLS